MGEGRRANISRSPAPSPTRFTIGVADPENRLSCHFPRRRLSAEELRDAMLAVSGRLDLEAGGAERHGAGRSRSWWTCSTSRRSGRSPADAAEHRSPVDLPDRQAEPAIAVPGDLRRPRRCSRAAPGGESSTHAPQALEMLNGTAVERPRCRVRPPLAGASRDPEHPSTERTGSPSAAADALERDLSLDFLRDQPLDEFALALFNLNGFVYVP